MPLLTSRENLLDGHTLALEFVIALRAPLDHSDSMELERDDIEQLPRAGKPAVKEDVARGSLCVKRLLQQADHDSRGFLTCHLLAFM